MALKKSELYSSLWSSCDELRGGMDASQYKDYVLVLLFIKYVSDKYADMPYAPISIPEGASFKDMVALKGKPDIGEQINKKIIAPLVNANKLSDMPDFHDATKLGSGKEQVDRLTNLIAIFENPGLDFSKNRAEHDDILGDAYEYLMRHFATESGKSKGQFYTPAEVSRIIAQILGVSQADTTSATTAYDPTCGSGSLLLKIVDEAKTKLTLYGQEKDAATSGLARMNMILHNNPEALIAQGNTLTDPTFKDGGTLKTFDYVVANPPFSDKRWSTGLDPLNDEYERFKPFGVPPAKQGDYAYLLHIVRSLKSTGKGACILPHGVLFRGNAEADIRRALVKKGYIKGIIGLPANLFYGTGIPACIIVIDKENAQARKGIFMVDASAGFMKDGPKNRLRSRDIHKIVDVFSRQTDVPKYSRMVNLEEIEKNDFNLNLPRYIDSQQVEDLQDIEGHLHGGIPTTDVDTLQSYWDVCPQLRQTLFKEKRPGYLELAVDKSVIKPRIYEHPEFAEFIAGMNEHFNDWRMKSSEILHQLEVGCHPKDIIAELSEDLLTHYTGKSLIDQYDVYQHLMDYWAEIMQDDCYLIATDGWKAETYRVLVENKKGKQVDKGWACDLVPKSLIVARYFTEEQEEVSQIAAEIESLSSTLTELEEEHSGDEGVLSSVNNKTEAQSSYEEAILSFWQSSAPETFQPYSQVNEQEEEIHQRLTELEKDSRLSSLTNKSGNITIKSVDGRLKVADKPDEIELLNLYKETSSSQKKVKKAGKKLLNDATAHIQKQLQDELDNEDLEEIRVIQRYIGLNDRIGTQKTLLKEAEKALDAKAYAHYPKLSVDDVKVLAVDDKWLARLDADVHSEMDRISQSLTQRVKELAERYENPLPEMVDNVAKLEEKVNLHLEKMGFKL